MTELDLEKKTSVFKSIAECELHYAAPRYNTPQVMYQLKQDLKENLDRLGEKGILDIIASYKHLPKEFPSDLLDEVNQMISLTLEHNYTNIRTEFLIQFLDIQNQLPK